jgi:hypothetical protein
MQLQPAHIAQGGRRIVLGVGVVTHHEESEAGCVREWGNQLLGRLRSVREDRRAIQTDFAWNSGRRLELVADDSLQKQRRAQGRACNYGAQPGVAPVGESCYSNLGA